MRAVVQRVLTSDVSVDNDLCGSIKKGLNVLLGVEKDDTETDLKYMVDKITKPSNFLKTKMKKMKSFIKRCTRRTPGYFAIYPHG